MTTTAYANSSWHWVADNPLTILPWAVVLTLFVEIIGICYANHFSKPLKPAIVISAANIISFLSPYAFIGLFPEMHMENLGFFERINDYANKLPFYIVGIAFLLLTLLVEIPVVYIFLKKDAANKKHLFISIVVVNCITTLIVAIIERMLFKGSW